MQKSAAAAVKLQPRHGSISAPTPTVEPVRRQWSLPAARVQRKRCAAVATARPRQLSSHSDPCIYAAPICGDQLLHPFEAGGGGGGGQATAAVAAARQATAASARAAAYPTKAPGPPPGSSLLTSQRPPACWPQASARPACCPNWVGGLQASGPPSLLTPSQRPLLQWVASVEQLPLMHAATAGGRWRSRWRCWLVGSASVQLLPFQLGVSCAEARAQWLGTGFVAPGRPGAHSRWTH